MAISLFEHNQKAYQSALSLLASTNKAAIIHPTGTGKSFIGFKLAEGHPNDRVLWLSPSEYIVKTQLENLKKESGVELKNIIFVTYVRLMLMSTDEIAELKPDWIIMDEYHRCGAERWSDGIANLVTAYPTCPMLGLSATNIRYLDSQRDMAMELFDGNIASEMTLGEAIVRGILLKPKYVVALYSYEDELNGFQSRINATKNDDLRRTNQDKLDALRRSLDNADGIDKILEKHITDRTGKYIVFCSSVEEVVNLKKLAKQWFHCIDSAPHIYSVYSYFEESSGEFDRFKADESEHIKLLYCVDMLNEGIHVENISGVILCRLTVSPTVYKQQIGRALSASKTKDAVIFDFVNNFKNLCSVKSIVDEVQESVAFFQDNGMLGYIFTDSFNIIDEVRDSVELFNDLEDTLSVSWNHYYNIAHRYFDKHKNLDVPISYKTDDGVALGQWLNMQRKIRRGTAIGLLTPARIKMLDAIGMRWERVSDALWEDGYAHAAEYYNEHRNLDIKERYVCKDGFELGLWLSNLRKARKRGANKRGMLTDEHIAQLDALGMQWTRKIAAWDKYYPEAKKYYEVHGDLNTGCDYVTADGIKLGEWLNRCRLKPASLTKEQRDMLKDIGMSWESKNDAVWYEHYADAEMFYKENEHLNVDYTYKTADGFKLGMWLYKQRGEYAEGALSQDKIGMLNKLEFDWESSNLDWEKKFSLAKQYYTEHGDLNIKATEYVNGVMLGPWLRKQRLLKKEGRLSAAKIRRLSEIGMEWLTRNDAQWERGFESAKRYYEEHGNLDVPKKYKSGDGFYLGQWIIRQRGDYAEGELSPERTARLNSIGMAWLAPHDALWEQGFNNAKVYYSDNGNLNVPRGYRSDNGYNLGAWLVD